MSDSPPSTAAQARALLARAHTASLGTVDAGGAPHVSLVAVCDDGTGRPLFLLSGLAEHTRNLRARPAASLLVTGEGEAASLDRPRVTLQGRLLWLKGDEAWDAQQRFVAHNPEAAVWVTLPDFAPARLEPESVRLVGGFARAATVSVEEYLAG